MRKTLLVVTGALAVTLSTAPGGASASTVQRITGFGSNPTGIGMYLYTPSNVVSHPPLLVGVHACHGKGTDVCTSGSPFAAGRRVRLPAGLPLGRQQRRVLGRPFECRPHARRRR